MLLTPLLLVHICGAVIGILSGFAAMLLPKGRGLHAAAGTVFFVSMLTMSASAAFIATFLRPVHINVVVSLLTIYLVVTARRALRNRATAFDAFDTGAMIYVFALALLAYAFGLGAGAGREVVRIPAPAYFIFGTVALLCALTDLRFLRSGGLVGPRRLVRHLWRMGLALLIATLSLYPGQAKLFPPAWRETKLLIVPHLLLFGSMIVYALRMRRKRGQLNAAGREARGVQPLAA